MEDNVRKRMCVCVCVCMTGSLHCAIEIDKTLKSTIMEKIKTTFKKEHVVPPGKALVKEIKEYITSKPIKEKKVNNKKVNLNEG